jgi:hypothetical protein
MSVTVLASSFNGNILEGKLDRDTAESYTETDATTLSNEETIFNFLVSEVGLNTAAACGVLANIEKESNFISDIVEIGYTLQSGGGYGICQWTNYPRKSSTGRRSNLFAYCNANGYDSSSLIGQLHYLQYELTTSYPKTYQAMLSVPNTMEGAYKAGYTWCKNFEVPANTETTSQKRGAIARDKYWAKYQSYYNSYSSDDVESTEIVDTCVCTDDYTGEYIANGNAIVFRSGHSLDSSIVAVFAPNTEVTVTMSDGTWAHVTCGKYEGITLLENLTVKPLYGDLNQDDVINQMDILLMKEYLFNTLTFDDETLNYADVNRDGLVNVSDLASVKHIVVQ